MKNVFLVLLFFTSSRAMALSDFDRAVLFASNGYSMGTYIAQMEGEIARIKLNYAKRFAEFQKDLETDYQVQLKESLQVEIETLQAEKNEYAAMLLSTQTRIEGFSKIVELTKKVYQGRIKTESLLAELQNLNEVYPNTSTDLVELMQKTQNSEESKNLTSANYENIFFRSLRQLTDIKLLEKELKTQIEFIQLKIDSFETELKALP